MVVASTDLPPHVMVTQEEASDDDVSVAQDQMSDVEENQSEYGGTVRRSAPGDSVTPAST
jgi:hypothetical protein